MKASRAAVRRGKVGHRFNGSTRNKAVHARLASAVRLGVRVLEQLETRQLLAASVYVGENLPTDFTITNDTAPPGLSNGDTVTWNPSGTQHPQGAVAGLIFGTDAFAVSLDYPTPMASAIA